MCVCVCACVCVRACVRAFVCVCVLTLKSSGWFEQKASPSTHLYEIIFYCHISHHCEDYVHVCISPVDENTLKTYSSGENEKEFMKIQKLFITKDCMGYTTVAAGFSLWISTPVPHKTTCALDKV